MRKNSEVSHILISQNTFTQGFNKSLIEYLLTIELKVGDRDIVCP